MKAIYLRYIQYRDFMEDINRLKLLLVEKKKTGKWLAEQLGKTPSTISKGCSNVAQPDLATLVNVANLLEVDIQELINKTMKCRTKKYEDRAEKTSLIHHSKI